MKIFVNEFHDLKPYCDTVIKGFCYQINEDGSTMLYPYKDFELLMSIQQLYEEKEKQVTELQLALVEMYEEKQAK